MKYVILLLAVIYIPGCISSSRTSSTDDKNDPYYYNLIECYDGTRVHNVYEGEIAYLVGGEDGGTAVMKNGRQLKYVSLTSSTFRRIEDRHRKTSGLK